MKVLCVINALMIGGAETLFTNMAIGFKRQGMDVDVLILQDYDSDLRKRLIDNDVTIISLHAKNIYNPLLIIKLMKFIKGYDVVHSHLFPSQYWVAIAKIVSRAKVPLVTTEHSSFNKRRKYLFTRLIDSLIYYFYDRIITISDKATTNLLKSYNVASKTLCIYNGVDVSTYNNATKINLFEDDNGADSMIIITMVASFRYPKDQDTVIRAVSLLPSDYHAVFVGDGRRLDECKQLAQELGIESRVHFLGIRNDVPSVLKSSDVIVMSSRYEGLSLSSIEGMCVGKPFIASDVDGLKEIVQDSGLLFKYGDYKALAGMIEHLMNESSFYEQIASKCMKKARYYDVKKTLKKYKEVYVELLNQ